MQAFKITYFTGIFVFLMSCLSMAAPITQTKKAKDDQPTYAELLTKLDKSQMEEQMGRKLNFVERIVVKRLQKKIRKKITKGKADEKASPLSIVSIVFSSIAIPVMVLSLAVLPGGFYVGLLFALVGLITGAIESDGTRSRSDKIARIGMWLGVASLILGLLLLFVAIILILSFFAAWN